MRRTCGKRQSGAASESRLGGSKMKKCCCYAQRADDIAGIKRDDGKMPISAGE